MCFHDNISSFKKLYDTISSTIVSKLKKDNKSPTVDEIFLVVMQV